MATTAAQTPLGRSASSRNYQSPADSRHRRTASGSGRTSMETAYRHDTNGSSHARAPTSSQQQGNTGVARRDHETTNLPQVANGRQTSSRDQAYTPSSPTQRRDVPPSSHHRTDSRSSRQRYSTDVSRTHSQQAAHSAPAQRQTYPLEGQTATASNKARGRTSLDMPETGTWSLQKTIGAGSMGKVKLARNIATGEQCALKIVPRQSTEEFRSQRERERADHSKDVRTAREAAIVKLLKHPYICGMKDVMKTNHHWYMLFEYVNGGQMLDYIISHGRLKEKQARKFARQIASALDYCHKNSIVHRDLKIENILISKTGDIKIIDFGLSNLYSPGDLLKTFCGSLYFAAPELLQAQHYDGPEVDVWSFGIVLYVLVCGKVPFDDQSMPQLHAKIKKGQVDYPNWLSAECKHLISRMLVTDRKQRAPLSEIMTHPWMTKGYSGPLENYLPHREPIQLPLDEEVVASMTGFEFGTSEEIKEKLTSIIATERYQVAARLSKTENITATPGSERRRGVFDFYKRRNSTTSRDSINNASSEAVNTFDPLNAFAKELSIYYLAREKLQRERTPKSSSTSVLPLPQTGGAFTVPELTAPKAAYTNASTYERPGEKPTGGRSRPRARTQGEEEVTEAVANLNLGPQSAQPVVTPPTKKESMAGGILRRLSTRRTKDRPLRPEPVTDSTAPNLKPPAEAGGVLRRGFSMRKPRTRDMSASADARRQPGELLAPPDSGVEVAGAGQKILARSSSVNSADWRRLRLHKENEAPAPELSLTSPSNLEPPPTSGSEQSSVPHVKISEPNSAASEPPMTPMLSTPSKASTIQRSATTVRAGTKSLGHARRESIQARRVKRNESRNVVGSDVPEETEKELLEANEGAESQSEIKPVFLKGLFSVSTTSTKPLPTIRADIIRVLHELSVEYVEIKGGFSCVHSPSINLNTREMGQGRGEPAGANMDRLDVGRPNAAHKRRISLHGIMGGSKEAAQTQTQPQQQEPKTTRSPENLKGSPSATDESDPERPQDSSNAASTSRRSVMGRPAGETTTHVENDTGANMVLRFEIFVVKVPLFALHGIQFKKVSGGTWSYKEMAQRILNRLRL